MAQELLSTTGILDEAVQSVRKTATPWLGLLWLTALPLRFGQCYFVRQLSILGRRAEHYGHYLGGLALLVMAAFVLSLYGRAVYVRANRLSLQAVGFRDRDVLRVPWNELVTYLYTALAIEAAFFATLWAFAGIPIFIAMAGLAAASAYRVERPGLLRPWLEMKGSIGSVRALLGLLFFFVIACFIVWINLSFAVYAVFWLAKGISGIDISAWEYVLRPSMLILPAERLPRLLFLVASIMVVEPFWLASLTVYVYRSRVSETGEDLRRWFHNLAGEDAR